MTLLPTRHPLPSGGWFEAHPLKLLPNRYRKEAAAVWGSGRDFGRRELDAFDYIIKKAISQWDIKDPLTGEAIPVGEMDLVPVEDANAIYLWLTPQVEDVFPDFSPSVNPESPTSP